MTKPVLFSGYYGLGNAGDEAVLAASVAMLRSRVPGIPIRVLSGTPAQTAAELRILATPRMRPDKVLSAISGCSMLLSGGGSLLQDRTSLKSLLYYLALLAVAQRLGKKTMVFAQGIGPLVRPRARRLTARVLSNVDAITVRDADSAALLAEIGVRSAKAGEPEVTADPVFALEPDLTKRVRDSSPGGKVIAVSLRPWEGVEAILDPLAEALRPFAREASLQGWGLFPDEDLPVCNALADRLPELQVLPGPLRPAEWMAFADRATLVIGMRLHSLIFAAARAVPVAGISYDPKVEALLGRLRCKPVGTAAALDTAALTAAINAALRGDGRGLDDRRLRAVHLRDKAARNAQRALELLGDPGIQA